MHDNKPYVLALESKSKTKEGKIGKSILSLNRSFKRVIKALRRVNFYSVSINFFSQYLSSIRLTSTTILVNGD